MRFVDRLACALVLVLACFAVPVASRADDASAKKLHSGMPDLVGALKGTPGCLGVESAKTSSGKNVIFAWFEDKKAAMAWYNNEVHQQMMKKFFPDLHNDTPLTGVPDDSGPIMAIASITMNENPKDGGTPFKQIAIELYRPIKGGINIGGTFAPAKMKVPEPDTAKPAK